MPEIRFQGRRHPVHAGETVLEALERGGAEIRPSCRSGSCQSCMLRAVDGTPPPAAQRGLRESQRRLGLFLPCICRIEDDLEAVLPEDGGLPTTAARVLAKEALGSDVVRLRLAPEAALAYRPGQFLKLRASCGELRSYSIASVPEIDPHVELHVRRQPGGRVSGWVHESLRTGEAVELCGPLGECHYTAEMAQQPLLLIATGSGLSPLWGVVRDALHQGHRGPIHLYHGGRSAAALYLDRELRMLARRHEALRYVPCVSSLRAAPGVRAGRALDLAFEDHPVLKGWRVFLCGHPEMVAAGRKRAFLAGVSLQHIHADAFTLTAHAA